MPRPRKIDTPIPPTALKIAELRKAKGWNQSELAARLGTHLSNLARIEAGRYKPSIQIIMGMVELFDISADELLRPNLKKTAKEKEADEVRDGYLRLDEKQRANVRTLMFAYKTGASARVITGPMEGEWVAPEDGR